MMRLSSWRSQFVFPLLLVALLSTANSGQVAADATSAQDITLTPSSQQLQAAPGDTATGSFTIINEGGDAYTVASSVSPYHVVGESYDPQFTQLPNTVDTAHWVQLEDTKSRPLAARKILNLNYTVTIPKGTPPGGYYAVIFVETTPGSTPSNGVVAHDRVGDILYITVAGPVTMSGQLMAVPLGHITFKHPVALGARISNTGGIHFLSTTTVSVKSVWGKQVFHASLQRYVLPQTVRLVSPNWNATAPIGLYHVSRSAIVAGVNRSLPTQWLLVIQPWLAVVVILCIAILVVLAQKRSAKQTAQKGKK